MLLHLGLLLHLGSFTTFRPSTHASCILPGSAMSMSYCVVEERKMVNFNPWTYTQIHTLAVVQGGGGCMEPIPGDFDMLQYLKRFYL